MWESRFGLTDFFRCAPERPVRAFRRVEPALSACALTKRYGDVIAVSDLSFEVDAGSIVGFLGPNGAGKTTTLRMLLGLARPTKAEPSSSGARSASSSTPHRASAPCSTRRTFIPGGRAATTCGCSRSPPEWRRAGSRRFSRSYLEHAAKRRVGGYSLGMRQRLSLAAALLGEPELLVLDEPANGLDPEGVRWLREFLCAFAAEGKTVLVSSDHLAEVEQTVDSVVIIDRGRLVTALPLESLTAESSTHRGCVPRADRGAATMTAQVRFRAAQAADDADGER